MPSKLPPFIEFGVVISTPPPVVTTGGSLLSLVLSADEKKLDAIVQRVLNDPPGCTTEFRALGSSVILQLGGMKEIRSGLPPFDTAGSARETQASFWIPVVSGTENMGLFEADRFGLFSPYVLVDNPMSLVGGREVFGYPKSQARFTPANGSGDKVSLEVYGGDFGPTSHASWHPFLDIEAVTPAANASPGQLVSGAASVLAEVWPLFAKAMIADDDLIYAGVKLGQQLAGSMASGKAAQVFLKQFRDIEDGSTACYQQVVEAPVTLDKVDAQATGRVWQVTVHPLDSHPLTNELGVDTQKTAVAFSVNLDFTVGVGTPVP